MLQKSRTHSPARDGYEHHNKLLRIWQYYTRNPQQDRLNSALLWGQLWREYAERDPEMAGHVTEVYFWADHEAGRHSPAKAVQSC